MVMTEDDTELSRFDDYLRFGTDEEREKETSTRKTYVATAKKLLEYLNGRELTSDLARDFIKSEEETGVKATTTNLHIWALKAYFRFKGLELKMHGLRTTRYLPRYLKDDEWGKLLGTTMDALTNPALPEYTHQRAKLEMALIMLYCGGGLRCSEAISLRTNDVHEEGFIRVVGKGDREDFVPVEDAVIKAVRAFNPLNDGSYIFPGKKPGTHLQARAAQRIIQSACKRAGLTDVHIHSLRHTAGYQLRKGGASERDIQDFMRHDNPETTQIYTHIVTADLRSRLPRRFDKSGADGDSLEEMSKEDLVAMIRSMKKGS
jgi:site-specific recombinase XerD